MSIPDLMRQKAAIFQRAAQRNPEQKDKLLGAAQSLQLAANVADSGLPEAKRTSLPPPTEEKS